MLEAIRNLLTKLPRMLDWTVYAVLLCMVVLLLAPQQLPVSLYKFSLIALAGVSGYWLDRSLFPYARPDRCLDLIHDRAAIFAAAMIRRSIIVAAAMLAMGLGA